MTEAERFKQGTAKKPKTLEEAHALLTSAGATPYKKVSDEVERHVFADGSLLIVALVDDLFGGSEISWSVVRDGDDDDGASPTLYGEWLGDREDTDETWAEFCRVRGYTARPAQSAPTR